MTRYHGRARPQVRTCSLRFVLSTATRFEQTTHVHQHPVHIPNIRAVLRHALPNVIEGKIIPLLLFIGFLELIGTMWALLVAFFWSMATIAYRGATGRRIPGLIVLSATALGARTIAALLTGSMVVYFLQPTVTTVMVGFAFHDLRKQRNGL